MEKTRHYQIQIKLIQILRKYIQEPILDLACGTGRILLELSKDFGDLSGNDLSLEMIKIAKTNLPEGTFMNEEAQELPFHQKRYNTLICCNLLFYLSEPQKALQKWKEFLTSNGTLIIIEEYPFVFPKESSFNKEFRSEQIVKPLTPTRIITLLNKSGWKLMKMEKMKIDQKHSLYAMVCIPKALSGEEEIWLLEHGEIT